MSILEACLVRHQRKRHENEESHGYLSKIMPLTFDGENRRDLDAESWLLIMRRYFHLYQYSPNLELTIVIYNLKGKSSIWWDELAQVKRINENTINSR